MTLADWCANLDGHWDEAVAEVGVGTARVWRLYMAGSRLGVRAQPRSSCTRCSASGLKANGGSGMPLRPDWEQAASAVR